MAVDVVALGAFLRARRDVVQPEEVGLFRDTGRRVAGLRRDEVARLAGISAEYYLRLEKGRSTRPSDQVLKSLAEALNMDPDSRQYLFRIASGTAAPAPLPAAESAERVAHVLSQWTHTPAYVSDSNRDIVASNPLATALGHGGLSAGSNVISDLFVGRMKNTLAEWEPMAQSSVAGLRRDADPASPRFQQLITALSADIDFARMWARHDVSGPEDARINMVIEKAGTVEIDVHNFAIRSMPGHLLTVLSAPPNSLTVKIFAALAASVDDTVSHPAPFPTVPARVGVLDA